MNDTLTARSGATPAVPLDVPSGLDRGSGAFRTQLVAIPAIIVVVAAGAIRAGFTYTQRLNPDELQHLHGAWCLAHGQWPYRDYFEHHTPWLHLALAPLLSLADVDRDPERATWFILLTRALMWLLSTIAIGLTGWLAGVWKGRGTGWVAAALLATAIAFVEKTTEVRPDTPAVVCLLGSWIAALKAWRAGPDRARARWLSAASGVFTGAAIMFTQKVVFTLPAWGLLLSWWIVAGRGDGSVRERVRGAALFVAGVLTPLVLTLVLFQFRGGAWLFLESNFLENARWRVRLSPVSTLRRISELDPVLCALGLFGLLRALPRLFSAAALTRGDALVVVHFLGLMAGAFVNPIPRLQYFVMLLPLLAAMAAGLLADVAEAAERAAGRVMNAGRGVVAPVLLSLGLLAAVAGSLEEMARRLHPEHPIVAKQLAQIHYVLGQTRPEETVMDGFTGAGVFRPHAWFYFFVHGEVRPLLGPREIGELQARLRDGDVAPALVLLDDELWAVNVGVVSFLRANYERTSDGLMWRLRRDLEMDGGLRYRLDLGADPSDVLAGRGWDAPDGDGERTFRRTRGRRSTLRVPLRTPADVRVAVRARADELPERGRVGLFVNGAPLGEHAVREGWAEYVFEAPAAMWHKGVNRVRLTHFVAPSGGAEGDDSLPLTLAVDDLQLLAPERGLR